MAELHDLTALEQGAALRRGELASMELVDHYLERIGRLSADVGAFVTVTAERARAQSVSVTADGPLAGVPTAVKDLNNIAGVPTGFGSRTMKGFVPDVSDEVVLRIERAGLVSLGKTTTPEFGSPCYTEPDDLPPARTPYDLERMAGGSSGGAAAAVAAGLAPVAQGSDGGGSIRIPSSCCGLFGLKPSRGRISSSPVYGDPIGLGTSGPIARSVRDAAALLDVMAGPTPGDPYWAPPLPPGETYLGWCDREPARLRVARFAAPVIADAVVHPESLRVWEETSRLLERLGHDVVDVDVPLDPDAVPVFETAWSVLTASAPLPEGTEPLLRPLTRWLRDRGMGVGAPAFGAVLAEIRRHAALALIALAPYDAVLTPTLAQPPLRIGEIRDDADPARDFENQKAFTPFTAAWNVTGMPAASLPLGWTPEGLPVGAMLAGRPAEEHMLLSLCAQVEAAAPWQDHRPPCW